MRWLPRLFGLALIVGLLAWSFSYSLDELEKISNRDSAASEAVDEADVLESSAGPDTPQYLAFAGGIPSGAYHVADLPSSNDWDYREKEGRTPAEPNISEGNPVNYELDVEDGPYVISVESSDGQSSDLRDQEDEDQDDDEDDNDNDNDNGDDSDGDEGEDGSGADGPLPSIKPGLYATQFGVESCEYELRRIMDDNRDHVIGHDHVVEGRALIAINEYEPDTFVATESCGEWSPWSPLIDPLTVAGDGDYWVDDLARGFWDVPNGCLWEKVISFRGTRLEDVESSGVGPQSLLVDQFTLGVRIRNCADAPMWLSDKPLPPQLQLADSKAAKEAAHARPIPTDRELTESEARRIERRRS